MDSPDLSVWLIAAYALIMLAAAWAVDVLGSRSARHSMSWRHSDFVYHDDVDGWRCHEDQWLWPTAFDPDKRVIRYEGAHAICGRCPSKDSCSPTPGPREITRPVDPWPYSDAGRFHRGVGLVIACVGVFIPLLLMVALHATGDLIVKLLRVLEHGRNPDVELSVALARSGWDRVRTPVAWSTLTWNRVGGCGQPALEESTDSAVACSFVPRADDGFELFCSLASTDDVDGPVRARAVDLARDLGRTTAQMHHHLAASLGTSRPPTPTELAASLRKRARWALEEVPELSGHIRALELKVEQAMERLEALEALEPATRIHGDYHLGQVLHEIGGQQRWYVLDFEGEPLRPLAQRSDPDLPARDVAGMLRSFDYAAAVGKAPHPDWLPAVRSAFEEGYRLGRQETGSLAPSPAASGDQEQAEASYQTVLTCLELDKALYEAVYEARNRPDWLGIPMAGIESVLSKQAEG